MNRLEANESNNYMKFKIIFAFFLFLTTLHYALAQNTRINENNNIGWYNFNATIKLDSKFGINSEYQWRRINYITDWQQSLIRFGANYQLNAQVQARAGYACIETFSYGTTPINSFGKDFTEHRTFEMITLNNKVSIADFSHRFILEQRWIGRFSNANLSQEDQYVFSNRFRYMFRMQLPLKGNSIIERTPYIAMFDELFIGFGENVNENIFDQNRFGLLLGYKFNNNIRLEAGYLNQTLQLGREINQRNVFQNNAGFLISTILNFDLKNNIN